jgi:lysophospholipase L1-like esterase
MENPMREVFRTVLRLMVGSVVVFGGYAAGGEEPAGGQVETEQVVLIGASYAKDWKISTIQGRTVVNKGSGGEQTNEMRGRFEKDVIEEEPAAVIIWGFINNLFRSKDADLTAAMEKARSDIMAMVDRAEGRDIQVILATEVTITSASGLKERVLATVGRWIGKESYQDLINQHVREVNAWMRAFAEDKNLVMLDFERVLSDDSGRRARAYAADDGSHISEAGYAALTEYVKTAPLWREPAS